MRIAVFGCGRNFNIFMLNKNDDEIARTMEIVCIVDNDVKIQGKDLQSVPVVNPSALLNEVWEKNIEAIVVTVAHPHNVQIIKQLRDLEISLPIYLISQSSENGNSLLNLFDDDRPELPYIECDLVSHCNLKCNGCGHLSNIAKEGYLSLNKFVSDFKRLSDLFANIRDIRLMGGEPCLHPQVEDFIRSARECFPKSNLHLVTNGLLLPSMKNSFFNCLNETGTILDISLYLPTFKKWFDIKKTILDYELRYRIGEPVTRFMKGISIEKRDYKEVFSRCAYTCVAIRDGRIAACELERGLNKIQEWCGKEMWNLEPGQSSYINIHDDIDGWEVIRRLKTPLKVCAYCRAENWKEDFYRDVKMTKSWRCNEKPNLSDWLYGMDER